nr:putative ribonuclease H-like domain-containing protein [Tanacetum cinerariifolium]
VQNRILVVKPHNKTLYELFRGRTPALSFMRLFGCYVTILNTLEHLEKFDGKSDDGFFVGYSLNSKAFRVMDQSGCLILILKKSMNYVPVVTGTNSNDFVGIKESIGEGHSRKEKRSSQDYILMTLWKDGSLFDSTLKNASKPQSSSDDGHKHDEVSDKESSATNELNYAFKKLSTEYPDDLKTHGLETIATYDDSEEEADFTNLESSIQMDEKSAFLYGRIEEEVYVYQPSEFEDPDHPDKVYKVVKALYSLHQAPRAWYETLSKYLLGNGFHKEKINQTLFIKRQKRDILLVQVYVDDIIFGSTKKELCIKFERLMKC